MTDPRPIYRTADGHRRIRRWCEEAIGAWGHPHAARTIPTSLGPTHVLQAGDGPDLVLLPGTNFAAATWLDLVAALATRSTVHAPDLPGQPGLSAPGRPRQAGQRYGRWLTELLAALELHRPVIVAHSLGGAVALRGLAHGARVDRLVLLDPAGVVRLRVSAQVMRPTLPWLRHPSEATAAALLRMMMAPGAEPDAALVDWMALVGRHVRTSLAPAPLPAGELRASAAIPVDVLSGRHDAFLPPGRLARAARRRLAARNVTIVDRAGHLLPHDHPDAVLEALRNPGHPC